MSRTLRESKRKLANDYGIIEFHPKIVARLAQIEATIGNLQREHQSIQISTLLAHDIDPDQESWQYDQEHGRMRRVDVRPPELKPELEVKPPQNGSS